MVNQNLAKPAPTQKLTVGLIQLAFQTADIDYNIKEASRLVDEAAQKGAQLIVLPELWSFGYKVENLAPFMETLEEGKTLEFMKMKAREHSIYICGGFLEQNEGGLPYNCALLLNPEGTVLHNHRKVELYTPGGEDLSFTPGDRFDVVDTPLGRFAILICYDGDFPEAWRIVAANKGADLILHPSAYETPCEELGWWTKLYEASAMTNAVWAVSVNLAGQTPDHSNYFGGSCIIDPMGNTVAQASYVKENETAKSEVLVMELDFAEGLARGRENNGTLVSDRKTAIFHRNGL